jgi:hypothetical protein
MIPSKTPEDNSSQPDGSSLGNAADYSGPGQRCNSSADDGLRGIAAIPIAPAREPLLSDAAIDSWSSNWEQGGHDKAYNQHFVKTARNFYESKITSGELRVVVKDARFVNVKSGGYECSHCKAWAPYPLTWLFCPHCGNAVLPL